MMKKYYNFEYGICIQELFVPPDYNLKVTIHILMIKASFYRLVSSNLKNVKDDSGVACTANIYA